jgi:hypothetical protein
MNKFLKVITLTIFSAAYINCAPKSMNASDLEKVSSEGNVVATDDGGSMVTIPLESSAPLSAPSNNLPVEVADVPSDLITILTPPVEQPAASSGIGGILGNLFGGFLGGNSGSGNTSNACGIISPILSIGATFLTGGNPILGMLVPQIANSLLSCGNTTSLAGLIPTGASGNQQIFSILSQIMQVHSQGKDPFALLNAIKNPQDLSAIVDMVSTLAGKSGSPELQNLLGIISNFQNNFDGAVGTCGNMNPMACQVFQIINQVRQENGLQSLIPNLACTLAAQTHSKDMFTNNILSHTGSDGVSLQERLQNFGIKGLAAENIVKGSNLSAKKAVEMWMNSSAHKKNILNSAFSGGGVGYINGYFTQCLTQ